MEQQATIAPAIGAPVLDSRWGHKGFVCEIREPAAKTYTIGANGMQADRSELFIVWADNLTHCQVSEHIAERWLRDAAAAHYEPASAELCAQLVAAAQFADQERNAKREAAQAARAAAAAAFVVEAEKRIPEWAQAYIVARQVEDQSDSMTDYWGSTTRRCVILGFSRHTRDLFPELRSFARNFAATEHLAEAPAEAEHREKYSMGGGFYLKEGGRHSTGWEVRKSRFYGSGPKAKQMEVGEWSLAPETPAAVPAEAGAHAMTIEKHVHTKKGFDMWICVLADRVERAEFDRLRDAANAAGGWYSRPWGKTPGGFAFKDQDAAAAFASAGH